MKQVGKYLRVAACCAAAASTLALFAFCGVASAQSYPSKPVRFITISTPGTDHVTRALADEMTKLLGQSVTVDNRPGGSGLVGATVGAQAAPDGYSVLFATGGTMVINNFVIAKMPFDTQRDFIPLAMVASTTSVLVINPSSTPVKNVAELISLAKAKPGQLNYFTFGPGSLPSVLCSLIAKNNGVSMSAIAYRGSADGYTDLFGGLLTMMLDPMSNAMAHIESGKVLPLAVTSAQRHPRLPDVPSMVELGLVDFGTRTWWGTYVPAGTPAPIVQRLTAEFERAVASPTLKDRFDKLVTDLGDVSGERFAAFQAEEFQRWGKAFKELGIEPQ